MEVLTLFQFGLYWTSKKTEQQRKVGDIIFTTYEGSLKARNIQRDNRVSICVDDQTPQFSFVTIHGTAKIYSS